MSKTLECIPPPVTELLVRAHRIVILPDWKIHWCGVQWCDVATKVIHLTNMGSEIETLRAFLHEATYALMGFQDYSEELFLSIFTTLQEEYLDPAFDPPVQKEQKSLESNLC